MSANPLKEYRRLREAILSGMADIEGELQELERALVRAAPPLEEPLVVPTAHRGKPKRVRNAMSLGDSMFSVTKEAPLSKEKILAALERLGFQFLDPKRTSSTPRP